MLAYPDFTQEPFVVVDEMLAIAAELNIIVKPGAFLTYTFIGEDDQESATEMCRVCAVGLCAAIAVHNATGATGLALYGAIRDAESSLEYPVRGQSYLERTAALSAIPLETLSDLEIGFEYAHDIEAFISSETAAILAESPVAQVGIALHDAVMELMV